MDTDTLKGLDEIDMRCWVSMRLTRNVFSHAQNAVYYQTASAIYMDETIPLENNRDIAEIAARLFVREMRARNDVR